MAADLCCVVTGEVEGSNCLFDGAIDVCRAKRVLLILVKIGAKWCGWNVCVSADVVDLTCQGLDGTCEAMRNSVMMNDISSHSILLVGNDESGFRCEEEDV